MADRNPTDCGEAGPAAQDAKAERAVLAFLLNEHPNQLTVSEVSWALSRDPGEFETEDAVERAIRELVAAGLLHCAHGFVVPTRAALYLDRLEMN